MTRGMTGLWVMLAVLWPAIALAQAGPLSAEQLRWYTTQFDAIGRPAPVVVAPDAVTPPRDATAEALLVWASLRRDGADPSFEQVSAFLLATPGWPGETALRTRAEQVMLPTTDPRARARYFDALPPLTATGRLRQAEAWEDTGRTDGLDALVRAAWSRGSLSPADETLLLARFGRFLTPADHAARADWLLWNGGVTAAQRLVPLLAPEAARLVQTRIALRTPLAEAQSLFASLSQAERRNAGVVLDRAIWLRVAQRDEAAAIRFLIDSPIDPATVLRPARWLEERAARARVLQSGGDVATAVRLLAGHGLPPALLARADDADRVAFVEAEWSAGWLALRTLRTPQAALEHFARIPQVAQMPVTLSRANYWAGRAAEALNDPRQAMAFYRQAAQHDEHFYGQLAAETIGQPITPPDMARPAMLPAQQAAIDQDPIVRAVRILGQLRQDRLQSQFINHIAQRARTPEAKQLAALLAAEINRLDLGVRIGKLASQRGIALGYAAYPQMALPPEMASQWTYIHAITRQESLFDTRALSLAGARGLMQLMPATAAMLARRMGEEHTVNRLVTDPSYNVRLGSTYFAELMDVWRGSHVLAVASYNGGRGNVRKWVELYGDPRQPGIDMIDWIEQIPFQETRTYVHRVLENAVVYRLIDPTRPPPHPGTRILSDMLGLTRDAHAMAPQPVLTPASAATP